MKPLKGLLVGTALLALIPAAAKADYTAPEAPSHMIANTDQQWEDGSGIYTQVYRYPRNTTAAQILRREYGWDRREASIKCSPTFCRVYYYPTAQGDGDAKLTIRTAQRSGKTIAWASGRYCLGAGYACADKYAASIAGA